MNIFGIAISDSRAAREPKFEIFMKFNLPPPPPPPPPPPGFLRHKQIYDEELPLMKIQKTSEKHCLISTAN